MAGEARLAKNIRDIAGNSQIAIYQGIVSKVDGSSCTIKFGRQEITDVRLRASLSKNDKQILIVPRKGTAVVVGSLSGDSDNAISALTEFSVLHRLPCCSGSTCWA